MTPPLVVSDFPGEHQPEEVPEPPLEYSPADEDGADDYSANNSDVSDDEGSSERFARSRRPDSAYHYGGIGMPAHRSMAAAAALDPMSAVAEEDDEAAVSIPSDDDSSEDSTRDPLERCAPAGRQAPRPCSAKVCISIQ